MTRLKNSKGFTLIELIVVIVIIGILVAIAAVAYNSIIAGSKKSALEASASQVAKIVQAKSAAEQAPQTDAMVADLQTAGTFAADGVKADVNDAGGDASSFTVEKDGMTVTVTYSDVAGGALSVGKAL